MWYARAHFQVASEKLVKCDTYVGLGTKYAYNSTI